MIVRTPVNQVRLTNVATVRLTKPGNKKFEIACYRNKVLAWRSKVETNLAEVLQIDNVFTNVSKGMLASARDLQEAFGTTDQNLVCIEILNKGEMQVSEQERAAKQEAMYRDIAAIVVDKTVNTETNRPFTLNMIVTAMRQIQFSVNVTKSSKSQALDVIKRLREVMPIGRESMIVRVVCLPEDQKAVTDAVIDVAPNTIVVMRTDLIPGVEAHLDLKIDPEIFRAIETAAASVSTPGSTRVEVIQMRASSTAVAGGTTGNITPPPSTAVFGDQTTAAAEEETLNEEETEQLARLIKNQQTRSKAAANAIANDSLTARERRMCQDIDPLASLISEVANVDLDLSDEEDDYGMTKAQQAKAARKKKNKGQGAFVTDDLLPSATSKAQGSGGGTDVGSKKSKKNKKNDREERRESEQRAREMKERIEISRKKEQEAAAAAASAAPEAETPANPTDGASTEVVPPAAPSTMMKCNTCGGAFPDSKAHREHFRSEWHKINLRRKVRNAPILDEKTFLSLSVEELAADA